LAYDTFVSSPGDYPNTGNNTNTATAGGAVDLGGGAAVTMTTTLLDVSWYDTNTTSGIGGPYTIARITISTDGGSTMLVTARNAGGDNPGVMEIAWSNGAPGEVPPTNVPPVANLMGDRTDTFEGRNRHYEAYRPEDPKRNSHADGSKWRIDDWWRTMNPGEWTVTLDGSGSTDDGEIMDWLWELDKDQGAGTDWALLGHGETLDVTLEALRLLGFADYQTYDLRLTVTDNGTPGLTDTDLGSLTLLPEPATLGLMALGGLGLALLRRRRS
jgi:hypothetical protein